MPATGGRGERRGLVGMSVTFRWTDLRDLPARDQEKWILFPSDHAPNKALGFRLDAAARQLGAAAGREVNPGIALVVGGRRAGAGMRRGLAIIRAGLRHAVALLELIVGLRCRAGEGATGREGGDGRERRADEKLGIDHWTLHWEC